MKVSINATSGLLIESQSDCADETLIHNAADLGFNAVEVREVTQEELRALIEARTVATMSAADKRAAIQAQINELETAQMLPRVVREFMLAVALKEAIADGYTEEQIVAANIGYAKLKAMDEKIKVLRAQL